MACCQGDYLHDVRCGVERRSSSRSGVFLIKCYRAVARRPWRGCGKRLTAFHAVNRVRNESGLPVIAVNMQHKQGCGMDLGLAKRT